MDYPKDPATGKRPTHSQIELMEVIASFEEYGSPKFSLQTISKILGKTRQSTNDILNSFKNRCPTFYSRLKHILKHDQKMKKEMRDVTFHPTEENRNPKDLEKLTSRGILDGSYSIKEKF